MYTSERRPTRERRRRASGWQDRGPFAVFFIGLHFPAGAHAVSPTPAFRRVVDGYVAARQGIGPGHQPVPDGVARNHQYGQNRPPRTGFFLTVRRDLSFCSAGRDVKTVASNPER